MASSEPSSPPSSPETDKRFQEEMTKFLELHSYADPIDFGKDSFPCVFRVPKILTETKPEAYVPQKLGLGPYHHLRPNLYTMQRKKLAAVTKFLDAHEHLYPKIQQVVTRFKEMELLIRANYDEYLNLDPWTLARIVAIDTIYILHHLDHVSSTNPDNMKRLLSADILMLENQIPVNLLLESRKVLGWKDSDFAISSSVHSFCKQESPLDLINDPPPIYILNLMEQGHLLNVLYNLILPNESEYKVLSSKILRRHKRMALMFDIEEAVKIAAVIGIPGAAIVQKELAVIAKVPWELILEKLKKADPDYKHNSSVEEISFPSASQLSRFAGIMFARAAGGIRKVEFKPEKKEFHLPTITLKSNSEVVLRNLLAYEAAKAKPAVSTPELAEYVDLMCGIVDTSDDVKILLKAEIIISDVLKPSEIALIFNGIRRSTGDDDSSETNVGKEIKKVKEVYDNAGRVKMARFIKKYSQISWKALALVTSALVVVLLAFQAFCNVYDCKKHWFSVPIQAF